MAQVVAAFPAAPSGWAAAAGRVLRNRTRGPYVAAVAEDSYPVHWTDRRAVVAVPDYIDISNAQRLSETLLQVINRGAVDLIVDMSSTAACDYAGADAVVRAYQRAAANGTQLRIVVTAPVVRRLLSINGLDRLVPVYPSLESATAAALTAAASPSPDGWPDGQAGHGGRAGRGHPAADRGAIVGQAVLCSIIDALADGVALADEDGTLVLASRRLEEMFGYGRGELAGRPVDALVPVDLRESHRQDRAGYGRAPRSRPMGAGAALVGLRADGTTLPVAVSLSPVPTATGHLVLAVVRDNTGASTGGDLLDLARRAAAAGQADASQDLLDRVVTSLVDVGVSLQAAVNLPHHTARQRIVEALQRLDDTIHQIRDHVLAAFGHAGPPGPRGGTG